MGINIETMTDEEIKTAILKLNQNGHDIFPEHYFKLVAGDTNGVPVYSIVAFDNFLEDIRFSIDFRVVSKKLKINSLPLPSRYHCLTCGGRVPLSLKGKKIIANTTQCKYKRLRKHPFFVTINCPSGELVIGNDFRQNSSGIKTFELASSYDLNSLGGRYNYTKAFSDIGLGMIYVGNTCPSIIQRSNKKIEIVSLTEDDYEKEKAKRVGYVCTDLWWYSICDRALFEEKMMESVESYREKHSSLVTVKVNPGTYQISSREHLCHNNYGETEIFSEIKWKKDTSCLKSKEPTNYDN